MPGEIMRCCWFFKFPSQAASLLCSGVSGLLELWLRFVALQVSIDTWPRKSVSLHGLLSPGLSLWHAFLLWGGHCFFLFFKFLQIVLICICRLPSCAAVSIKWGFPGPLLCRPVPCCWAQKIVWFTMVALSHFYWKLNTIRWLQCSDVPRIVTFKSQFPKRNRVDPTCYFFTAFWDGSYIFLALFSGEK